MIQSLGSAIDLFVHPGEYQFADENFCLRTTLGSCVAITLWHPERRLGGICHFMLPGRQRGHGEPLNGKYADEALLLLIAEARKLGTELHEYQAKLFGGGDMFPRFRTQALGVARRNVERARELTRHYGLRIKAESLGGIGHRNLIFDIARGNVWVQHLSQAEPSPDVQAKQL